MKTSLKLIVPLAILMMGGLCRAQSLAHLPEAAPSASNDDRSGMDGYITRDMQQHQLKKLRELHQKEVLSDTDRMVTLATAMKDEVDKGNKTLNADVMKDADEISKLAKRVSDRIKSQ
jgi:hypothetical protein